MGEKPYTQMSVALKLPSICPDSCLWGISISSLWYLKALAASGEASWRSLESGAGVG